MIAAPMSFMVDTCVWIDQLRKVPSREVQMLGMALLEGGSVWTCGPVLQELIAGVRHDAQAKKLRREFEALEYAALDDASDFAAAADIWRACRRQGVTVRSSFDCLIAQICLSHDVPLLTSDRDFEGIAQAVPLRLV
jgi:predicted nucleic acid-binding protein